MLKNVYIPQSLSSEKKKKKYIFVTKSKKTGAKNLEQFVYLVSHSHALITQLSSAPSYILELYQSQKVQLGERFSDSRILCHLCYYIHTLSLPLSPICLCVYMGEEAYLACYHFQNDLCFQPMMDCILLIDINFPEPGKKCLYSQEEYVGTRVIP